ncbi:MAG: T9SS type A sorting domain-containing protein, partial [Bacteroidia bacterium]
IGNNTLRDGNYYACRTDSAGNIIWEKDWGEFYQPNWTGKVIKSSNGRYMICGSGLSGMGGGISDITLTDIDINGNNSFLKFYDFAYADYDNDMMETPDSCLIIAGREGLTSNSHFPAFVKVDRNGNEIWRKTQPALNGYEPVNIRLTPDGGFISTGIGGTYNNSYYAKYDSTGTMLWIKYPFGNGDTIANRPDAIKINDDGSFVIYYGIFYQIGNWPNYQSFYGSMRKYDSAGNCLTNRQYSDPLLYVFSNESDTLFNGLTSDVSRFEMDETGTFIKKVGLNGDDTLKRWIRNYIPTRDGGYLGFGQYSTNLDYFTQFYIVKFAPDGRYEADEFSESVNAYPNPSADGNITLTFDMKDDNNVQVKILTTEGKLVYSTEIFCPANSHTELPVRLNENSINAGMYILEVKTSDSIIRKKIIVAKAKQ